MRFTGILLLCLLTGAAHAQSTAGGRALDVTDLMKVRHIEGTQLSRTGRIVAFSAVPDRGQATGIVRTTDGKSRWEIPHGVSPAISASGKWVIFTRQISLLEQETVPKPKRGDLKPGLVLINTDSGEQQSFERVKSAAFSDDWLVVHFEKPLDDQPAKDNTSAEKSSQDSDKPKHFQKPDDIGTPLRLINLDSGKSIDIAHVQRYAVADRGFGIAYSVAAPEGDGNRLVQISKDGSESVLASETLASYPQIAFQENGDKLAFLAGSYRVKAHQRPHQLVVIATGEQTTVNTDRADWYLPATGDLTWTRDGERLFFGYRPLLPAHDPVDPKITDEEDLYNIDKLLAERELQVWHHDDPRIKPNQKREYKADQTHSFLSVYHPASGKVVHLADQAMPDIIIDHDAGAVLGRSQKPYLKLRTWEGFFADYYHVDLQTGRRQLIANKLASANLELSPSGRYVGYYDNGQVWIFDAASGDSRSVSATVTADEGISFANELHDYPQPAPGYGFAGWLRDDAALIAYDRYDIWAFAPNGRAQNLTNGRGRKATTEYRIVDRDPHEDALQPGAALLVHSYHDQLKYHGFVQLNLDQTSDGFATRWREMTSRTDKQYHFVAQSELSTRLLFTREDLHEFPDLWVARANRVSLLADTEKLTDINPQLDQFSWGKPELVAWRSAKGKPLQGVLIKPANYEPGKRYPVLVYYYRYFSQRLYEFNDMRVNHRPNFQYYSSNGYAVFLPDIKFDVGTPGPSATDALVPGMQKIIDMGIADPDAIGLHGHSWSGYQTAFVVTETDIFAAAVAGAPVSNMTSAYSGIRLGSGLARQFQYEQSQSRIGATLYDKPHLYIENSPAFFPDRINTPLLIMHGDIDDAVPWQQSIELYLAMRRVGKDVIFLQYEGEPHHLKKYPNKVDYTLKMKAYFDHYLKGQAPEPWITKGVPYSEKQE